MRHMLTTCILFCLALSAQAALPGDSAEGQKLHDAHCVSCHTSSVYTRKDRQVKSLGALNEQLGECTHAAQVTLSETEQKSIVKYLNERFYKFK